MVVMMMVVVVVWCMQQREGERGVGRSLLSCMFAVPALLVTTVLYCLLCRLFPTVHLTFAPCCVVLCPVR